MVLIAANNNQHRELVINAAKARKDIICEKPVAMSVEDLDEMTREAEKYGVKFTVHQQRRLDKDYRTAKEIYDTGVLGDVYTIETSLYGYNGNTHDWHVFLENVGGKRTITPAGPTHSFETRRVLRLMDAVRESARTGKSVVFE